MLNHLPSVKHVTSRTCRRIFNDPARTSMLWVVRYKSLRGVIRAHSKDLNSVSLVLTYTGRVGKTISKINFGSTSLADLGIVIAAHIKLKLLTFWESSLDMEDERSSNCSEPKTAHIDVSKASSAIFLKCWLEFSASCSRFLYQQDGKWCCHCMKCAINYVWLPQ